MFLLMLELIDLKHTRRCEQHLITLGLENICILIKQKWIRKRKRTGLSAGRPLILTKQGSSCQRTYRSPRGRVAEANYRVEEVLEVGTSGSFQSRLPFRHSQASITNPAEHGETHPPTASTLTTHAEISPNPIGYANHCAFTHQNNVIFQLRSWKGKIVWLRSRQTLFKQKQGARRVF